MRGVDLVLEYRAVRTLVRSENYDLARYLRELKAAGITGIALQEQTLESLRNHGDVAVYKGKDLRALVTTVPGAHPNLISWVKSGQVAENAIYMLTADVALGRQLYTSAQLRLPSGTVSWLDDLNGASTTGLYGVGLKASEELLARIGLGFDPGEFQAVLDAGLRPVPRPRNTPLLSGDSGDPAARVRGVLQEIDWMSGGKTRTMIMEAQEVLGYPNALGATAAGLAERGWVVGLVESNEQRAFILQRGHDELAQGLGYRVARVYSIGQAEVDKRDFSVQDTLLKWRRSVVDRDIRILYLRPFQMPWQPAAGKTLIETNLQAYRTLADMLRSDGFQPGEPSTFALPGETGRLQDLQRVHTWQFFFLALGVGGGALAWLLMVWPIRPRAYWALFALGVLAAAGLAWRGGSYRPVVVALGAAVIFPALAATYLLARWRAYHAASPGEPGQTRWADLVRETVTGVLVMAGLSTVGGLFVGAGMGGIEYLLEFVYFRGVKLAFLAPLLLVVVAYLAMGRPGDGRTVFSQVVRDIVAFFRQPVRYGYVFLGLVAAVGAFVYLQRSGNFPIIPVPNLELKLRAFLEDTLIARPRGKEFMVGYPMMGLAALAYLRSYRRWVWPLLVGATTAGVSVVNSFSHLRTPVAIAFMRGVHGAWLGVIITLVGVTVAAWLLTGLEAALAKAREPVDG